ncbi:MAG: hypothetical protein F4204_12730 [Rhodospirillaceae bacterium]|nr:hypothetical protein [Rhodospirillaceae bacterium]MXW93043.1 hypothetical protein [Rhodospirillaceae bacterium]MYB13498.1 hypothetical protein [Rhodospirillaceae bacterium]MYG53170.1 hypothetical protein [Rhodospirillaceae bacterium]MYI49878.1 hypothetical protein [Rhodospirillaceae bacterium]
MQILDPSHEEGAEDFVPAGRLDALEGATVGVISNGKEGTSGFFAAFERELRQRYGVAQVVLRTKSNYSAPADAALMDEAKRWHALVAGVGD